MRLILEHYPLWMQGSGLAKLLVQGSTNHAKPDHTDQNPNSTDDFCYLLHIDFVRPEEKSTLE